MKFRNWLLALSTLGVALVMACLSMACANPTSGSSSTDTSSTNAASATATEPPATTTATKVYLVGDSTVCGFSDPYYYPRYGYGTQLGNYLNSTVTISNLALSGRSSKSFISEANYTTLTSSITAGDYLIIGFGHNDEKADSTLYTDPSLSTTDATSFKYYLYNYYVKMAQDKGAIPILCTPIVRRDPSGTYAVGSTYLHVTATTTVNGGDYAQCIRDLGTEKGVTVIDNTNLTRNLALSTFASGGASATANFHAWTSNLVGSVDNTHTNIYGAKYYAYLLATALRSSNSSLKDYVRGATWISAPSLSDLVANPNYVASTYTTPTTKSAIWTTTDPWWASVFGDVGGQAKITTTNFAFTENSGTTVTVRAGIPSVPTAVGKIASTSDGMAFYFQKLAFSQDFTLSATATVNVLTANDQVSFGLMVRDAIWIDTSDATELSPYVACGPLKLTKGVGVSYTSFTREYVASSNTYTLTGYALSSASTIPVAGSVIQMTIKRVGALYTVTYGNEAPKTYTIDMNSVDSDYVYAGLYAVRDADVTFSNITLTLN